MKFEDKYIELKAIIVNEATQKTPKDKYWIFLLCVDVAIKTCGLNPNNQSWDSK